MGLDLNPEFKGLSQPISYGIKTLGLDDKMPFGKHKGFSIDYLIDLETSYIRWFVDNVDRYVLSTEALESLKEAEQENEKYSPPPYPLFDVDDYIPF